MQVIDFRPYGMEVARISLFCRWVAKSILGKRIKVARIKRSLSVISRPSAKVFIRKETGTEILRLDGKAYRVSDAISNGMDEGLQANAILKRIARNTRDYTIYAFGVGKVFVNGKMVRMSELRTGDNIEVMSEETGEVSFRYISKGGVLHQIARISGFCVISVSTIAIGGGLFISAKSIRPEIYQYTGQDFRPVKILDRDGRNIQSGGKEVREVTRIDQFSLPLRRTLIASEDSRFGWNMSLDWISILRGLRSGGGASSINGQVARSIYRWVGTIDEKGLQRLLRKLREIPTAIVLENSLSKAEILELYMNNVYLGWRGEDTIGFEEASQRYFAKSSRDLDYPESAFLVALLKNPSRHCSYRSGKRHRDSVLRAIARKGVISDKELATYLRRPFLVREDACKENRAESFRWFTQKVLDEASEYISIDEWRNDNYRSRDYVIESTMNRELQRVTQESFHALVENKKIYEATGSGGSITINYETGEVLAYYNWKKGESSWHDDIYRGKRQVASLFKPFIVLKALLAGMDEDLPVSCERYEYIAGCSHGAPVSEGKTTMRDALIWSENAPFAEVGDKYGVEDIAQVAQTVGLEISKESRKYPLNVFLGGFSESLFNLTRAYSTIANGGKFIQPSFIRRIIDVRNCEEINSPMSCEGAYGVVSSRVIDQVVPLEKARALDALLEEVVLKGTAKSASIISTARGKTGTTNDSTDVYFIGYRKDVPYITSVWLQEGLTTSRSGYRLTSRDAIVLWKQIASRYQ